MPKIIGTRGDAFGGGTAVARHSAFISLLREIALLYFVMFAFSAPFVCCCVMVMWVMHALR